MDKEITTIVTVGVGLAVIGLLLNVLFWGGVIYVALLALQHFGII